MDFSGHIPIYKKLTEFYRSRIISQEYPPGTRIDSINRMMARHKVSRDTAKRVILNLVNEGLVISQPGKGTYICFRTKLKKIWGMVVPFYLSNTEQLISAMYNRAEKAGRNLNYFLHYNNPNEETRLIGSLIQQAYEAIIVVPNYDESLTSGFYRRLESGGTKIILADNTMAGSYFNYVIQSYDLGVKRVVDYLGEGRKGNFVLIGNQRWQGRNMVFELMEKTLGLIIQSRFPERQLYIINDLNDIRKEYILKNNIRGILSVHDTVSVRMIGRLSKWGFRIPEDISLVSYGNTELTEFNQPSITAIDCNYTEMSEEISKMILSEKEVNNFQVVIQPRLVKRNT